MAKIYKYVGLREPGEYYVLPIYPRFEKLTDWTVVDIAVGKDGSRKIGWGYIASHDLLESSGFYEEVGEIDLDDVVIRAVMESVKEEEEG